MFTHFRVAFLIKVVIVYRIKDIVALSSHTLLHDQQNQIDIKILILNSSTIPTALKGSYIEKMKNSGQI